MDLNEVVFCTAEEIEEAVEKLPPGVIARLKFNEAQFADRKNRNGRIYPSPILKKSTTDLHQRAELGEVLVNAGHPDKNKNQDDVAGSSGVAAILREAQYNESTGTVSITADIPDTSAGRDVKAIVKAGGKIGVSSRGRGTAKQGKYKTPAGEELEGDVIQDDYVMDTYDFVTKPSVSPARVSAMQETQEKTSEENTMSLTLEELRQQHPDLVKQVEEAAIEEKRASLLQGVETKLTEREDELRAEIREQILAEGQTDGDTAKELAGLKDTVASLKKENEELKKDNKMLTEASKKQLDQLTETVNKLSDKVNQGDVVEFLRTKTKDHPFGQEIYDRCKDAKNLKEAEEKFDYAVGLLEAASKKTSPSGKGLLEREDETETSQSEGMTGSEKARKLAGTA